MEFLWEVSGGGTKWTAKKNILEGIGSVTTLGIYVRNIISSTQRINSISGGWPLYSSQGFDFVIYRGGYAEARRTTAQRFNSIKNGASVYGARQRNFLAKGSCIICGLTFHFRE